jgi:hypothetical protein
MPKFAIRKYDGDDTYSYAVFLSNEVKKLGNQIFYGEASPFISGLSRYEAIMHCKSMEKKYKEKK